MDLPPANFTARLAAIAPHRGIDDIVQNAAGTLAADLGVWHLEPCMGGQNLIALRTRVVAVW